MSKTENKEELTTTEIFLSVVLLCVSIYSAYISWNCKSNQNKSTIVRVIYAFFAFMFGLIYQVIHAFRKEGVC